MAPSRPAKPLGSTKQKHATTHHTGPSHGGRSASKKQAHAPSHTPRPLSEQGRAAFVAEALSHARTMSYAMHPHAWAANFRAWADLGGTPESTLGGTFLRMYLDHKVDTEAVDEAGKEIGASEKFATLSRETQAYVQQRTRHHYHGLPTATQIEDDARTFLQTKKKKKGIEFRGKLNPVIGGVEGIDVLKDKSEITTTASGKSKILRYTIQVNFADEYHFNNVRHGLQDRFRKELSKLVASGQFSNFWDTYHAAIYPHVLGQTPAAAALGRAGVFACFMYALEMNKITQGLAWNVTIPMEGTITYP